VFVGKGPGRAKTTGGSFTTEIAVHVGFADGKAVHVACFATNDDAGRPCRSPRAWPRLLLVSSILTEISGSRAKIRH